MTKTYYFLEVVTIQYHTTFFRFLDQRSLLIFYGCTTYE